MQKEKKNEKKLKINDNKKLKRHWLVTKNIFLKWKKKMEFFGAEKKNFLSERKGKKMKLYFFVYIKKKYTDQKKVLVCWVSGIGRRW